MEELQQSLIKLSMQVRDQNEAPGLQTFVNKKPMNESITVDAPADDSESDDNLSLFYILVALIGFTWVLLCCVCYYIRGLKDIGRPIEDKYRGDRNAVGDDFVARPRTGTVT